MNTQPEHEGSQVAISHLARVLMDDFRANRISFNRVSPNGHSCYGVHSTDEGMWGIKRGNKLNSVEIFYACDSCYQRLCTYLIDYT